MRYASYRNLGRRIFYRTCPCIPYAPDSVGALQIYGFTFTTIAKGAFLIRASIIFTPILCTIAGEAVPVGLWVGALTGFAGSIMISLDPSKAGDAAASAATGVLSLHLSRVQGHSDKRCMSCILHLAPGIACCIQQSPRAC